jgi:hypothetical protein
MLTGPQQLEQLVPAHTTQPRAQHAKPNRVPHMATMGLKKQQRAGRHRAKPSLVHTCVSPKAEMAA